MDPITRATQGFAADVAAFWRAHPGRLLPLIAEEEDRALVVQALRLRETSPDNRRPIVVHEEPFATADVYFARLAEHVAEHYEAVREGVAAEGVALGAFEETSGPPMDRAAMAIERAAHLLGEGFDGLVVALIPAHLEDVPAWREGVRSLGEAPWSPRVRIAVLSPPVGPLVDVLGDEGARLDVNTGAALAFVAGAEGGGDPSTKLRSMLLAAAAKSEAGEHEAAAERYSEAAALCSAEEMPAEEAGARMMLGSALMAAKRLDDAVESYTKAAGLATAEEAWAMASQAWLGAGGALRAAGNVDAAAVAYEAAEGAARKGGVEELEAEARRMRQQGKPR